MGIYSLERAGKIVAENTALIEQICASYRLPPAYLKAVLLTEIPEIDLMDVLADTVVRINWARYSVFHTYRNERHTRNPLRKFDSSTGYGQIFAQVAIEAILFAKSAGIVTERDFPGDYSPSDPEDLQRVWMRLNRDTAFNLSCTALNIIHAAYQMTGRTDFKSFREEEKKLIFSRYNGNVSYITAYGERAFGNYLMSL